MGQPAAMASMIGSGQASYSEGINMPVAIVYSVGRSSGASQPTLRNPVLQTQACAQLGFVSRQESLGATRDHQVIPASRYARRIRLQQASEILRRVQRADKNDEPLRQIEPGPQGLLGGRSDGPPETLVRA